MRKLLSILTAILFVGSMMAETSTLTFTAKCNGSGTADDGASWTVTSDGSESNFDNSRGIHYGTKSASVQYLQLSTSDIAGTISSVVVNASDATASATISVKVGTTDFTTTGATTVANETAGADYTFTGSASGEIVVKLDRGSKKTKALYVKSIVVTYETAAVVPVDATAIELDKTTLTIVEGKTATLKATLTPADATTAVTWESSNESVATVAAGKVTAVAEGTATITAKAGEFSATCAVTVTGLPDPTNCAEASEAALSVSENNVEYKNGKVYTIKGYVTDIQTEYTSQNGYITFWMADTEDGGKVLEAYKCTIESAEDAPVVGDYVAVTGKLTKYYTTPEFAEGCTVELLSAPVVPTVTVNPKEVELTAEAAATQTIALAYENWGEATLTVEAATDAEWISNIALNDDNSELTFDVAANEGAARSATITITATANETVATATITVSQAKYKKPVEPILPIEGEHNYVKVTATEDITTGCYLIVYEGSATIDPVAFDGSKTTLDATNNGVAVEIAEGKIASSDVVDAAYFAIDAENGTILSASGKYIGVSSNSNGLGSSDDAEAYTHTFTIDEEGNAIIAAVFEGSTMTLRYNYASNQARFRYYKSGQQAVALYKQVATGGTTALDNTAVEAKAVKSLQNGMLIIEKAGVRYNVMGQVIR